MSGILWGCDVQPPSHCHAGRARTPRFAAGLAAVTIAAFAFQNEGLASRVGGWCTSLMDRMVAGVSEPQGTVQPARAAAAPAPQAGPVTARRGVALRARAVR